MRRRMIGNMALSLAVITLCATVVIQSVWGKNLTAFDQLDLLVDIRHELVRSYVTEPDQERMIEAAVQGMIGSVKDPYTTYIPQDELDSFNNAIHGEFSGIGAEVDLHNDRLRIVSPLEDSPAWKAGVLPGDVVLTIDGETTEGMSLSDAVSRLLGEAGTDVTIDVRHRSGEEDTIQITRARIKVLSVRGFRKDADNHHDFMLDPQQKIGYVRLTQFTERTADELGVAIEQLQRQGAEALIIDLRFNPGGLLTAAINTSEMFLPRGKRVVSVKGRAVPEKTYDAAAKPIAPDLPLVVLVNEASASASEIVTGALKDHGRAHVVGTRTYGKGSVQQVLQLGSGQGALKITNAYYYIPSGRKIHRVPDAEEWGVDPTDGSYVPMTVEEIEEMVERRRDAGINGLFDNGRAEAIAMTPAWIEEHLKDPQLAAALTAAVGRVETGAFAAVGESNKEELIEASRRANLQRELERSRERIELIEEELAKLDVGVDAEKAE